MHARADFRRLWAGQTISELGSQVTLVALPLTAILVLHASAFSVALLTSFEYLPFLVFGVLAGVWVDRLRYRRVLIFADVVRAAVLGSIPVADAFGVLTLAQLYAVAFVAGSLTVFFSLAYHAYLPTLVERDLLVRGNARLETTRSIAQTAGPAAGGGLVSLLTAPIAIAADAISFCISALFLLSIRTRDAPAPDTSARHLRTELREGVAYLWRQPILRANLFSAGLANFSYGIVWALVLVYAVRVLDLGAAMIGIVLAAGQAVGIVGAAVAPRIARRIGIGPTLIGAMALPGPAILLIAFAGRSTAIPFLAAGWALWSLAALVTGVTGVSIRQALVPQRLQGRVAGATRSVIFGVAPVGALVGGTIATTAGYRTAFLVAAVTGFATFVPLFLSPARRLRELPREPEELGAVVVPAQ
jgi:MFS family permease